MFKMNSIIGLIHCEAAVCPAVERIKPAGITEERITLGGKVISIQVPEEDTERVKHILAMENVMGVKSL